MSQSNDIEIQICIAHQIAMLYVMSHPSDIENQVKNHKFRK